MANVPVARAVPGENADTDELWEYLREGIDLIMAGNAPSQVEYTNMYSTVFRYHTFWKPSHQGEQRGE